MGDWQQPGLPARSNVNIDPVDQREERRVVDQAREGQGGLLIDEVMPMSVNFVSP